MRQTHQAGDKLFVDYAGQAVPIVDASTGEITRARECLNFCVRGGIANPRNWASGFHLSGLYW